jgi:hypothetical protein
MTVVTAAGAVSDPCQVSVSDDKPQIFDIQPQPARRQSDVNISGSSLAVRPSRGAISRMAEPTRRPPVEAISPPDRAGSRTAGL